MCIKCELTTNVMKCEKCKYNCCTKCELQKYTTNKMSTKSTERDYMTKTSPMTFQNRLFEKVHEISAEKQTPTADKTKSGEEVAQLNM